LIQCIGKNTPDVTITITKNNIVLSDGFVFDLEGVTSIPFIIKFLFF